MQSSLFSLTGKVALITGAASGIGESIARLFAEAGAMVYVADREELGAKVAAEIKETGGQAEFIKIDITDEAQCAKAAQVVTDVGHELDILVNNAGIGSVGKLIETTGETLDKLYEVNVRGMFNMCKVFLPGMLGRRSGNIINMASIGGVVAIKDRLAYCTTKFAVVGLTKCIALDYATEGIRANCICPGRVETPFVKKRIAEYPDPEKAYKEMAATQAIGRMGTPEEIAAAALYLASDHSAFVTGSAFIIDGGLSVGK